MSIEGLQEGAHQSLKHCIFSGFFLILPAKILHEALKQMLIKC